MAGRMRETRGPLMTLLELIRSTTGYFEKHGIESPRLNAEHLVAHALSCQRLDLYLQFERVPTEVELGPLREMVRKRAQGIPLQHLLGTAEFHGRSFLCDARALVPRPETEQLVEFVLAELRKIPGPAPRLLDVGTGSGVIALTLAVELPGAVIEAVDRSPAALALAQENATRLALAGRVQFREADLLAGASGHYQAIIANLPYIPAAEIATLSREVRHDPPAALDGGGDGLDLIRRLIDEAPTHLAGGLLALEIGAGQVEAVRDLGARANFRDIRDLADYAGCRRFVFATYG